MLKKHSSPDEEILSSLLAQKAARFIHQRFLVLLISSYACASLLPQFGLWIRHTQLGQFHWMDGSHFRVTLSSLMLSFLLFNAGLGIKVQELTGLRRRPAVLFGAFIANLAVPIILVVGLRGLMRLWHNSDELENLLVGLAMIVSMPIAGSSTAWSQNANGNLSLSLGLVFLSTVLSPLTTPLVLNIFGSITTGDYASDLRELALGGTNAFMMITVVLPSILGMLVHFGLGEQKTSRCRPFLKLFNFVVLLLLNYSNAATSLPSALGHPDWDFLSFILGTTIALCSAAFGAGWLIARWLKTNSADRAALMFGLGMNNNGTGLVLAAQALSDHPAALLPIIFYTLVQQVLAALVDWKLFKTTD